PTFLERLHSGTFLTNANVCIKLTYTGDNLEETLKSGDSLTVSRLKFLGEDGNEYRLCDLKKDSGFGGVESTLVQERRVIEALDQQLQSLKTAFGTEEIPVVIGDICYFVSTVTPSRLKLKSDFEFKTADNRSIVWV